MIRGTCILPEYIYWSDSDLSTDLHKKNKFPLKLLTLAKIDIQPCCTVCVDTRMGLFQNGQKNALIMRPYPVPHPH